MCGYRNLSLLLVLLCASAVMASEKKDDKDDKDKKDNKEKKDDKDKKEEKFEARELEGRRVIVPPDLQMDVEWYSPIIAAEESGKVVRGWVRDTLVILETEKHNLICIDRVNGSEKWRCVMEEPIRYEPAVSRNNVVVNVNNNLVAIERDTGEVRWRLKPSFQMSAAPLVVDPPLYPAQYKESWSNLETFYVGSWEGRIQCAQVRGRLRDLARGTGGKAAEIIAPEFDLWYPWHKTHTTRGVLAYTPQLVEDQLFYATDDGFVRVVSREAEEREPYQMQAKPATGVTVTPTNIFVGGQDLNVYVLDRYTTRRKWTYNLGKLPAGRIYADEGGTTSQVLVPTKDTGIYTFQVALTFPQTKAKGAVGEQAAAIETFSASWNYPEAQGVVGAGQRLLYVGNKQSKDFVGFKTVAALEKGDGKLVWKTDGRGVRFFMDFNNAWRRADQAMRLYAVTEDNRVVSFKEYAQYAAPLKDNKPLVIKADDKGGDKAKPAAQADKPEGDKKPEAEKKPEGDAKPADK